MNGAIMGGGLRPPPFCGTLCGCVAMRLCSYVTMLLWACVAMWLCGSVAMYLCGYVAIGLCGFVAGHLAIRTTPQHTDSHSCTMAAAPRKGLGTWTRAYLIDISLGDANLTLGYSASSDGCDSQGDN